MPSNVNSATTMVRVEPGDETGDYYVTFCNLPFNSAWQDVKDWISACCPVKYVELFPISSSGWIRLRGKANFKAALAHMEKEPFKGRCLVVDGRNETEAIEIRVREAKQGRARSNRRANLTGRGRGRGMAPGQIPPARRLRTQSLVRKGTDDVGTADATAGSANDGFLAFFHFVHAIGMSLQYYAPQFPLPVYNEGSCNMGTFGDNSPYYYGHYSPAESAFADCGSQNQHWY